MINKTNRVHSVRFLLNRSSWSFALMLLPVFCAAQSWTWKTVTAMTRFSGLTISDSIIWGATQGGIAAYSPQKDQFETWTNSEGLVSNQTTAIAADDSGRIWIGHYNGLIQRLDPKTGSMLLISDYKDHPVTCLESTGDTLWVGLDIGISLYLVKRREVKETYKRLGPNIESEIPVNDVLIHGHQIWVATDQGVASAVLGNTNLLDPHNWTNLTTQNNLLSNEIRALVVFDQRVYVGSADGIIRQSETGWEPVNTGLSSRSITDFAEDSERLIVLNQAGTDVLNGTNWEPIGSRITDGLSLSVDKEFGLYIGRARGLALLDETGSFWENRLPDCPLDNRFSDLAVDQNGTLWTCSSISSGNGFSRFDGSNWTNFSKSTMDSIPTDNVGSVAVDLNNDKWFGTFGGGAYLLESDSIISVFDQSNSLLTGFAGNTNSPVVLDVSVQENGSVWFLNFASHIKKALISLSAEGDWTNYGTADGIFTERIKVLLIDNQGRKWIGTENGGVAVFDDNGTPADKSDDQYAGSLGTTDGLESLEITALAQDRDNTIWVGTRLGLYTYIVGEPQVTRIWWTSSDNITAIEVDGVNNIWVGHDAGISYRRQDDFTWHHLHQDNSQIANNTVLSLESNAESGQLYVGTSSGLSMVSTPFAEPHPELQDLKFYPNPFKPLIHHTVTIDELAVDVAVHIYSSSGLLVRKFENKQVPGRKIVWDGRDDAGQTVSSGIYLVVAQSENNESRTGKLALVR